MKDVSAEVLALQPLPLLVADASGAIKADPNQLMPGNELRKFGWTVLDASRADGLTYGPVPYTRAGIDSADKKAIGAGRVFIVDRERGSTRLFFVWLPTAITNQIALGRLVAPLNFHLLFHPPTYEGYFRKTRPYWNGRHPVELVKNEPTADSGKALFVQLGIRYLCSDFSAIAHHVMAVAARDPSLAYVVPVADHPANFDDLVDPSNLLTALRELYEFITRALAPQRPPQFDIVGKVMLSAYSRSGNRLTELMRKASSGHAFFSTHLAQLNAFDINLGDNDAERLPVFTQFWADICSWRAKVNPAARAFVYTAYRSHYRVCKDHPVSSSDTWNPPTDINMDGVPWSDKDRKAKLGPVRDMASECYNRDAELGIVCLPVTFFEFYLRNGNSDVGNPVRGWASAKPDLQYRLGGSHGHGLFLRGMLSHALARAAPVFFGGPTTRT